MHYFPSSLSGYRQFQHHRCRLGSARRFSELLRCCAEHASSGTAHSGPDRVPCGADRCQAGGFPHYRPQFGRTCRWFRWQQHQNGKSGQDYRCVLLCRRDFGRSRSILFRVRHFLQDRSFLVIHHHLPNTVDTK